MSETLSTSESLPPTPALLSPTPQPTSESVTIDAIDAGWLSAALQVPVRDVEVAPVAVGEGFMSELARVAIDYDDAVSQSRLPPSVVAKTPSREPGSVALGQLLRLWEREARFYLDVAPRLPVRTPQCYYAGGNEQSGLWSLLLEDLGELQIGDQVAGATQQQAETAVDWLARFHGQAANEPALQQLPWLPDVATDPMYQGLQPMLEAVWPAFVEKFGECCPEGTLPVIERCTSQLSRLLAEKPMAPTVIHADYRLDNLFFGSDGELVPIDWQAPAQGQGLYDLAYFMGGCLDIEDRRRLERDLLQRWSEGVQRAGGTTLPPDELWQEYRRMVLIVMTIQALLMGQLDLTVNERAVQLSRRTTERMYTAGADLEVGSLVDR